jgi:hypothetical protein
MSRILQRLNVLAICLLGGVLGAVLLVQFWPRVRALAQSRVTEQVAKNEAEWTWPKTLQVCPAHAGDPVKLIEITKGGVPLQPGKYELPKIAGNEFETADAFPRWLGDVAFTLRSEATKNIVSVGIAVMLPVRSTDLDCISRIRDGDTLCHFDPHWCDGGCPVIRHCTLHWGLIPTAAASGLRSRYASDNRKGERRLLQGRNALLVAPGEEVTLSAEGRAAGWVGGVAAEGSHFPSPMNAILSEEGLEEAKDARPCVERANSRIGCAFAEVPKFNFGIDIVYFEDGTMWGNFGYGYATPNPDGIFTRLSTHDTSDTDSPASGPN